MNIAEYESFDGLGLAELLKLGEISPQDLMRCAVELADRRGRNLNAICHERFDDSLSLAKSASLKGSFGAVPFLLKDSALPAKRFPSSVGSRLLDIHFKFDATLVQRFEAAGFLPFARSTVPEFCMAPTTEAVANGGPTLNPWELTRSPGGSSGGAAAAVASRIVPIAHANDGGGSIRIPASCCGIYGLKPSRGLVPMGPARGEGWGGLAAEGVVSRTVRDTAAALDAIVGFEPGAPYAAPKLESSFMSSILHSFDRPLRVISCRTAWDDLAIASECVAAVQHAEDLLRGLGHEVVDVAPPPINYAKFIDALTTVLAANVTATVNSAVKGRPHKSWQDQLEPVYLDAYQRGYKVSAEEYIAAIATFHSVGRRLETYLGANDFLLTPTLATPPVPLGVLNSDVDFQSFRRKVARYTPFLAVVNASGQPAATLPLYWSPAGLPIGVQLVGHFGRDVQVLQLSAHLERVAPWAQRRPPLDSA